MLYRKLILMTFLVYICSSGTLSAADVLNGSFENGLKSWKTIWFKKPPKGGTASIVQIGTKSAISNRFKNGKKSLYIKTTGKGVRFQLLQAVPITGNKTYKISFALLTENNKKTSSSFRVQALDSTGKHLGYFCYKPLYATGNEWVTYKLKFKAPINAVRVVPEFNFYSPVKCWLDDVSIKETELGVVQTEIDWKQFGKLNHKIGQSLDRSFREAGERIDIAIEDLKELKAQGRPVPALLLKKAEKNSNDVFNYWLKLEQQRLKFYSNTKIVVKSGYHILKVENISSNVVANTMATPENIWFGIRQIKIKFSNGRVLVLTPDDFRGGRLIRNYGHKTSPSDAMFTYSQDKIAMILAEIPPEALPQVTRKAILLISGLDCDKELTSKIRITLNNYLIFNGKDKTPFSKNNWTDVEFKIPAEAFKTVENFQSTKSFYKTAQRLLKEVESFDKWAINLAEETDKMTLSLRKKLIYRQVPEPEKSRFLRGICFHGYNGLLVKDRTDKKNLPYPMFDYEYQAKAMRGIGANLIYSDVYSPSSRKSALMAFNKVGLPIAQVGRRNFSKNSRDIRFSYYFTKRNQLLTDLKHWLKRWQEPYKMFWAVGIDEPVIVSDFSNKALSLPDDPKLHKAFIEYLNKRKIELTQNNIALPEKIDFKAIQMGKQGKPLWLELQKFMSEFLGNHLLWLDTQCKKLGLRTIPIIMSHNHYFPQECSYVTLGRKLPIVSTDLYHNGDLYEGFNIQLFRNAVDGTAWMTPGSGYSCKTPDRFRRSLALSMVYSDGVLQWTNLYSSKFRGPSYFWRSDGNDGLASTIQSYWNWSYWPEMEDMFKRMKHSDPWLSVKESTNKVILLYSERQAILNSFQLPRKYFSSKYFYENLSLYAGLIRSGISTDVGYIETAARKSMSKYKVAILSGARALTPKQIKVLQEWVQDGGTLIVSANTGTQDQWGQALRKYSLADIYGIEKSLGLTKITRIKKNPVETAIVKVELAKSNPAKVLRKDKNGIPILLSHRFGKGRVMFFAMENIGSTTKLVRVFGDVLPLSGISELISPIVKKWQGTSPVTIHGLPEGVEVQVRKKGDSFVVHLLDWHDNRLVTGQLIVNLPGKWQVFYPNKDRMEKILTSGQKYKLRNLRIHDMLVVKRMNLP